MNDYQKEQYETMTGVRHLLKRLEPVELSGLANQIEEYLEFRKRVEDFLSQHFSGVCTHACYQNRRSACCSRDGIITFFADVVINMLVSGSDEIDSICALIQQPLADSKCIYLGENGCTWRIKPIVCEMFLCDSSMAQVFDYRPRARQQWAAFVDEKKRYTWPDQPVLFDQLESYFIDAGYTSPLMYLHNSPGLLRVKQKAKLDR
ncbi:MAG: hypothetical protein JRF72_10110 [Deltaproteobacteria bacterium]|jgi:hypothetical protein|nr:hypothetical protein [Deltaproteobacteria bacterium]